MQACCIGRDSDPMRAPRASAGPERHNFFRRLLVIPFACVAIREFLLLEEGLTGSRYYDRVATRSTSAGSRNGLRDEDKEYIEWVGRFVQWKSSTARKRLTCYYTLTIVGAVSAVAIAPVLASPLPTWLAGVLGFVSSSAFVVETVLQDQKLGLAHHMTAVRVQRALREFKFAINESPYEGERARFERFRREVEDIKESEGAKVLDLMRNEPSLPTATSTVTSG